jgi:hypothetical protein
MKKLVWITMLAVVLGLSWVAAYAAEVYWDPNVVQSGRITSKDFKFKYDGSEMSSMFADREIYDIPKDVNAVDEEDAEEESAPPPIAPTSPGIRSGRTDDQPRAVRPREQREQKPATKRTETVRPEPTAVPVEKPAVEVKPSPVDTSIQPSEQPRKSLEIPEPGPTTAPATGSDPGKAVPAVGGSEDKPEAKKMKWGRPTGAAESEEKSEEPKQKLRWGKGKN